MSPGTVALATPWSNWGSIGNPVPSTDELVTAEGFAEPVPRQQMLCPNCRTELPSRALHPAPQRAERPEALVTNSMSGGPPGVESEGLGRVLARLVSELPRWAPRCWGREEDPALPCGQLRARAWLPGPGRAREGRGRAICPPAPQWLALQPRLTAEALRSPEPTPARSQAPASLHSRPLRLPLHPGPASV